MGDWLKIAWAFCLAVLNEDDDNDDDISSCYSADYSLGCVRQYY